MEYIAYKINHPSRHGETIYSNETEHPVLRIGAGSYANYISIRDWQGNGEVRIGKFCSIAGVHCFLHKGGHDPRAVTTHGLAPFVDFDAFRVAEPKSVITVGNDVWIGDDALILENVTVGDGAVLGTRAVVTKDVPPYAVVAGNPATVKKYRFPPKQIESLLSIAWWDWQAEKIVENAALLYGRDIEDFIVRFS